SGVLLRSGRLAAAGAEYLARSAGAERGASALAPSAHASRQQGRERSAGVGRGRRRDHVVARRGGTVAADAPEPPGGRPLKLRGSTLDHQHVLTREQPLDMEPEADVGRILTER